MGLNKQGRWKISKNVLSVVAGISGERGFLKKKNYPNYPANYVQRNYA